MRFDLSIGSKTRSRVVLTIGDEGAFLVQLKGRTVVRTHFAGNADDEAITQAEQILADPDRPPLSVLIDVLEQSYRQQNIPPVGLADRGGVLRRRLEAAFPDALARGAIPLPTARREKQRPYLFAALSQSPGLDRWLEILGRLAVPPATMALLPVEALDMVAALTGRGATRNGGGRAAAKGSDWIIYTGRHHTGGFRQVVMRQGALVFTRLTPPARDDDGAAEIAGLIETELRATLGYVARLGYAQTDRLELVVLDEPGVVAELEGRPLPSAHAVLTTPARAAQLLKMPDVLPDGVPYSDFLHAVWFARKTRSRLEILPREMVVQQRLAATRQLVRAANAAALVAGLLYLGWAGYDVWTLRTSVESLEGDVARARAALSDDAATRGQLPVSYAEMAAVQASYDALAARSSTPWPTLIAVARQLGEGELVQGYLWQSRGAAPGGGEAPPAGASVQLIVEFASIRHDAGRAVAAAEALRERLAAALPDSEVAAVRLPVKVLPNETLSSADVPLTGDLPQVFTAEYRIATKAAP